MSTALAPVVDVFCATVAEAIKEVERRKRDPEFKGMLTTYAPSPYGGFRVHSEPAEGVVDDLVDPMIPGDHLLGWRRKRLYR